MHGEGVKQKAKWNAPRGIKCGGGQGMGEKQPVAWAALVMGVSLGDLGTLSDHQITVPYCIRHKGVEVHQILRPKQKKTNKNKVTL